MNLKSVIKNVNRRSLTNNTQKVALKLLAANGEWVSRGELSRVANSAAARVRDIRKTQFGGFTVECASAASLNKRGDRNSFYYRIRPNTVTRQQLVTLFNI